MIAVLLYHLANPHLLTLRYGEGDVIQILLFFAVSLVTAKIASDAVRLRYLAGTDDLTSLLNLRSFEAQLARMIAEVEKTNAPLALLVLDIDRLKNLNDAYGHLAGAEAVRFVGRTIARLLPAHALACRYGGDEFVLALQQMGESEAVMFAETVRQEVELLSPTLAGQPFPTRTLSVSIGISCSDFSRARLAHRGWRKNGQAAWRETDQDALGEKLFQMADRALYAAKNGGRNRICVLSSNALEGIHKEAL
jgi:diguanylate cyclase (GGDEF)-like protein